MTIKHSLVKQVLVLKSEIFLTKIKIKTGEVGMIKRYRECRKKVARILSNPLLYGDVENNNE